MIKQLPDEVLVYDLENHQAHCLNASAALVPGRVHRATVIKSPGRRHATAASIAIGMLAAIHR